jgi:hypothetical protein
MNRIAGFDGPISLTIHPNEYLIATARIYPEA